MRTQWFVALVPDGVAFDPVAHRRWDIDPDEVNVLATETAGRVLISLITDITDPGLVTLETKTWCHVAREIADGSLALVGTGYINPQANQRIDEDLVSIEVYCSPRDWETAQAAALVPLQEGTAYDPILIDPERLDDPVEILDGYSRVVFCHPVSHEFSVVDIFGHGLPVVVIDDPDWPGPSPEGMSKPVARVDATVSAEWLQRLSGWFWLTEAIRDLFPGDIVSTLTGEDFANTWFKAGDNLAGDSGYTVVSSSCVKLEPTDKIAFPDKAGPFHGPSTLYNYVSDEEFEDPIPRDILIDRTYFDVELKVAWEVAQKRIERVKFSIVNGSPAAAGGAVETLDLTCQDVSLDDTTPFWQPDTGYGGGAVVRVGPVNWRCDVAHVSLGTFAADLFFPNGSGGYIQRWTLLETNASPIGKVSAESYFQQARGHRTLQAAIMKARAILASSSRAQPFRFETELTDALLYLTTAHVVRVRAPGVKSGWIEAKVTDIEIVSNSDDEYLAITVAPAAGSGIVVAGGAGQATVSATGQPWDRIIYADYTGQPPMAFPAIGGSVIVENLPGEQIAHIYANDFDPGEGRNDPKVNEPLALLKEMPTSVTVSLMQIGGREDMVHEIDVQIVHPWSGPKQNGDA